MADPKVVEHTKRKKSQICAASKGVESMNFSELTSGDIAVVCGVIIIIVVLGIALYFFISYRRVAVSITVMDALLGEIESKQKPRSFLKSAFQENEKEIVKIMKTMIAAGHISPDKTEEVFLIEDADLTATDRYEDGKVTETEIEYELKVTIEAGRRDEFIQELSNLIIEYSKKEES